MPIKETEIPVLPRTTRSVGLLGTATRPRTEGGRAAAEEVAEAAAITAVVAAAVLTMKSRRLRWAFMMSP